MKQRVIKDQLRSVCKVLDVSFNAFFNVDGKPKLEVIRPNRTKTLETGSVGDAHTD